MLSASLHAANQVAGRDWSQYDDTSEYQILKEYPGNPNDNYLRTVLSKWFNTSMDNLMNILDEYGTEILNVAADLPDIVDNLKEAVEHEAQNAVEQAGEAIDEVVEVISDIVSDTVATEAGWFS